MFKTELAAVVSIFLLTDARIFCDNALAAFPGR